MPKIDSKGTPPRMDRQPSIQALKRSRSAAPPRSRPLKFQNKAPAKPAHFEPAVRFARLFLRERIKDPDGQLALSRQVPQFFQLGAVFRVELRPDRHELHPPLGFAAKHAQGDDYPAVANGPDNAFVEQCAVDHAIHAVRKPLSHTFRQIIAAAKDEISSETSHRRLVRFRRIGYNHQAIFFRQLDCITPEGSGRPRDENSTAGLKRKRIQCHPSGHAIHQDRASLRMAEAWRGFDHGIGRDGQHFRVGAIRAARRDESHDVISDLQISFHAIPNGDNDTRSVHAGDVRQWSSATEHPYVFAAADQRVGRIDRRRVDPDEDLSGAGNRIREFEDFQDFRSPEIGHTNCLQVLHSSFVARMHVRSPQAGVVRRTIRDAAERLLINWILHAFFLVNRDLFTFQMLGFARRVR
ncbi:hypothetical protein EBBID32_23310 [Sphingobium indicum BiD32]|uniref:Uncharacterized protein n=1 Tax=Sphingobium indicum BiD32 TaxID=1301087 RepID=N1MLX3_9SPHN|nr:hypothetical protein EBBID32_23310 [Sphingobium indicum BiD32]